MFDSTTVDGRDMKKSCIQGVPKVQLVLSSVSKRQCQQGDLPVQREVIGASGVNPHGRARGLGTWETR